MSDTPPKRKRARRSDALDLTEAERKERKRGLDARYRNKQANIRKTSVNIESQMTRWLDFKTMHGVTDDEEVAKMLFDHYERWAAAVNLEKTNATLFGHFIKCSTTDSQGVAQSDVPSNNGIDRKVKVEPVDDSYNSLDNNSCSSGNHGDEACFSRNQDYDGVDGSSSESGGLVMKLVTDDAQDTVVVYKNAD